MTLNRKLVLFIATSLDGYIATKDESLEWLFKVEGEGDNGFSEFYNTVDTIIMGKKTYNWIMNHDNGKFPYEGKECYVFTRSTIEDNNYVKFLNKDVVHFTNELKEQDGKNIWIVGGGELLYHFIKEGVVDEFIITFAPTVIGSGIPLFKEGDYQAQLSLVRTRTFNQFVELHYVAKQ